MKLILLNVIWLTFSFQGCGQIQNKTTSKMKVAVWDTYVTKTDGTIMHFDILASEEIKDANVIYNYGRQYLKTKQQDGQALTSKECRFCHVETVRSNWVDAINKQGYFIIEIENCD